MPDIRYVCLSDLHFGAENSILSCLKDAMSPSIRPSPAAASTHWSRSCRPWWGPMTTGPQADVDPERRHLRVGAGQ